ncbi:MAG: hypothetical protein JHC34_06430 [Acidobacteria bacterium]|nr:hypothetical protein [Acidobacteriota bacterium]
MKRLAVFSKDARIEELCASFVPSGWEIVPVRDVESASQILKPPPPELLLLDGDPDEMSGIDFLRLLQERRAMVPAVVFARQGELPSQQIEEMSGLGVVKWVGHPLEASELELALAPYFVPPVLPAMRIVEFLASAILDAERRYVTFSTSGVELGLLVGHGRVATLVHASFRDLWRKSLVEAGFAVPPARADLLEDLLFLEQGLPESGQGLVNLKRDALLACLGGVPSGEVLRFSELRGPCWKGLIGVPIQLLVPALAEKAADADVAVLKSPSVSVARREGLDLAKINLTPQQGFVLYQCEKPIRVVDLLQTGSMPEGQMLRILYLLMLFGAIETIPAAGQPPRLSFLADSIEDEQRTISIQSGAIENLMTAFQTPGLNPWKVLGVPQGASMESVSQAHDAFMARLDRRNLHPEVYKKYSKEVTFLQAKCTEACLLIQGSFLEARLRVEAAMGGAAACQAKRVEQAKTGRQEAREVQQKEADRLFHYAQELFEGQQLYECTQYLKLALFYDPGRADCYHLLGKAMASAPDARGKHAAEKAFLQAVNLDPWEVTYLLDLSQFYLDEGLLARCATYLEAAQKINPKEPRLKELFRALKERK